MKNLILLIFIGLTFHISAQEGKYTAKLKSLYEAQDYQKVITFKIKKEDEMSSKSLYYKAMAHYMNRNDHAALTYFDKAIAKGPVDADMYYYKATTLYYLKKYSESVNFFELAINLSPDQPDFLMGKGYSLYKLEKFEEAKACFLKAASQPNVTNRVYAILGNVCFDLVQFDDAITYYKKALSFNKPTDEVYQGLSFNLALVYQSAGRYDEAKETFNAHILMYPDDYHAYAKLIQIYYKQGDYVATEKPKEILLKAYYGKNLPWHMKIMYCFDQFEWQDRNVLAYSSYEKSTVEFVVWKHKFLFEDNASEEEFKILTVLDSAAVKAGKPDQYRITKIANDTTYFYDHLIVTDTTSYPELKKAILMVLDNAVSPVEKTGGYAVWLAEQRKLHYGGAGDSFETAILVNSVSEEYEWIRNHYPGSNVVGQDLLLEGKKVYDKLYFRTATGEAKEVYFDITEFFGKY